MKNGRAILTFTKERCKEKMKTSKCHLAIMPALIFKESHKMQPQQKIHHRTETADNFYYKNNGGVSLTAKELGKLFEDSHRYVEKWIYLTKGDN